MSQPSDFENMDQPPRHPRMDPREHLEQGYPEYERYREDQEYQRPLENQEYPGDPGYPEYQEYQRPPEYPEYRGYRESQRGLGRQGMYPSGPRRGYRWLAPVVIAALTLALVFVGGLSVLRHISPEVSRNTLPGPLNNMAPSQPQQPQQSQQPQQPQQPTGQPLHASFNVDQDPHLAINNQVGNVTIHKGDTGKVVIDATERVNPPTNPSDVNPSDFQFKATQDTTDKNSIKVDASTSGASNLSIDLNITVPENSTLQSTVNTGNTSLDGVSGQMDLKTGVGGFNFSNGTIKGTSNFNTDKGMINFDGALASNGNYTFNTNTGTINLTLPSDSAFTLNASTNVGFVHNDFGSNTVGNNPTSQLHVRTSVGTVSINKK